MIVYSHAKANYIERVLGLDKDQAGDNLYEFAREQMILAVEEPVIMYQKDRERPPIYIRNGVAVPFRVEGERAIPTAYHADRFLKKIQKDGTRKPA